MVQNHGEGKVGKMPPHWNKVAFIKRWLSYNAIFDAVVWLDIDMDTVLVDFKTSVCLVLTFYGTASAPQSAFSTSTD